MDGHIGGDEGQAVGQFEAFLGEGASLAIGAQTQGRFVDQVEGQTGLDSFGGLAGPTAEQVPGAQAQMFGREQPNAHLITGDLVGQSLADLAFEAFGISREATLLSGGSLGGDKLKRRGGVKGVESFFEGRSRR